MVLDFFKEVKKLVLIAVCSDDYLVDKLVLKGGNAMDMIYRITSRSSIDIDFSVDIDDSIIEDLEQRLHNSIKEVFAREGYEIIDWKFLNTPSKLDEIRAKFWGGYTVEFKVITLDKFIQYKDHPNKLSVNASSMDLNHRKKFEIDISNFEYCREFRREEEIAGLTIYVYSLEMIVFEKLRALCQQMPEYLPVVEKSLNRAKPRPRDFYDIYLILDKMPTNIYTEEHLQLLYKIFEVKHVDLGLLSRIKEYKNFHLADFPSLKNTITNQKELKEFDFYFDYVVTVVEKLESLRIK